MTLYREMEIFKQPIQMHYPSRYKCCQYSDATPKIHRSTFNSRLISSVLILCDFRLAENGILFCLIKEETSHEGLSSSE